MSSIGQKIYRKAQVLGNKISTQSRMIGEKANEALRSADVGLRKTENTLKNVIIPGAGLVGALSGNPQIGILGSGLGAGALAGVKNLRGQIKEVQPYTNVLEKGNYRKTFDDAVKNNLSQNSFI